MEPEINQRFLYSNESNTPKKKVRIIQNVRKRRTDGNKRYCKKMIHPEDVGSIEPETIGTKLFGRVSFRDT